MKGRFLAFLAVLLCLSMGCSRDVPAEELSAMQADLRAWKVQADQALRDAQTMSEQIPHFPRFRLVEGEDSLGQKMLREQFRGEGKAGADWVYAAGLRFLVHEAKAFLRKETEDPGPAERRQRRWAWLEAQITGDHAAQ